MENNNYKVYASQDWVNEKHSWEELKNKPFGEETIIQSLIEEQTVTIESNGSYKTDESLNLIAGKTYYVTFDNNTYEYVAKAGIQGDAFSTYVGNGTMLDENNEGNGEPFVFYSDTIYKDGIRLDVETFGAHTIALSCDVESIKTIDLKYLPEHEHSWNDLTDKPFDEITVKKVLAETRLTDPYDESDAFVVYSLPLFELVRGEEYIVRLDGTDYHGVASNGGAGSTVIYIMPEGYDHDLEVEVYAKEYQCWCRDPIGISTISIRQEIPEVKKISGKFVEGMGYVEESLTEILPEQELVFAEQNGLYTAQLNYEDLDTFSVGARVKVLFDGVEYALTIKNNTETIYVGNAGLIGLGDDTGESFLIACNIPIQLAMVITSSTESAHTVAIYEVSETIHLIDSKFLPEEATAHSNWNQNDETQADYIKNRPFYDTIVYEPIVQDLTVTTFTDRTYANLEIEYDFEIGNLYEVVINGVKYTNLVANEIYNTDSYIGTNLGELEEGSEPPFCVLSNEGWLQLYVLAEGEYTVTINERQNSVHYLDPKYIKDMYYSESTFQTLIEEQSVTTVLSGDSAYEQMSGSLSLTVGQTYTVVFNGTTYKCVAYEYPSWEAVCIGNGSIIGAAGGNGEPFCIENYLDKTIYLRTAQVGTHIVSISGRLDEVHKIDEKYLINSNIINGSSKGSLRTIFTTEENEEYTIGNYAFACGGVTKASGVASHAEGYHTIASGTNAHAEGYHTTASGGDSHAEGYYTTAFGYYSHAEGNITTANSKSQHTQGEFNVLDTNGSYFERGAYAHIVGNGTSDTNRSNAHTLDWEGNAWFAGDVYVGSTSGTNKDEGSVMVAKIVSSTTEVADGDASPYPEGTLYVVISE